MKLGNTQSSSKGPGESNSPQSIPSDPISDVCTTINYRSRRSGSAVDPSGASSMNFGNAQSTPEGPGEPYSPQSTTTDAMSDSCTTICSQLRRGGRAVEPSAASSMRRERSDQSNPEHSGGQAPAARSQSHPLAVQRTARQRRQGFGYTRELNSHRRGGRAVECTGLENQQG